MGNDALFSLHSESSQFVLDGLWTAVQLAHRCSKASPRFDPLAPPPAVRSGSTAGLVALGGFYSQATASGDTCCVAMETDVIQNQEWE